MFVYVTKQHLQHRFVNVCLNSIKYFIFPFFLLFIHSFVIFFFYLEKRKKKLFLSIVFFSFSIRLFVMNIVDNQTISCSHLFTGYPWPFRRWHNYFHFTYSIFNLFRYCIHKNHACKHVTAWFSFFSLFMCTIMASAA